MEECVSCCPQLYSEPVSPSRGLASQLGLWGWGGSLGGWEVKMQLCPIREAAQISCLKND